MEHRITIYPGGQVVPAANGENLLAALRAAGAGPDAPCGGRGTCGKCTVIVGGVPVRACTVTVERDLTVTLPTAASRKILTHGLAGECMMAPVEPGYLLAFDIGTTTLAGCLMDGVTGTELAVASQPNPQSPFGADVISRIQWAMAGDLAAMTACIRNALADMTQKLCRDGGVRPEEVGVVSIVGNPAMQQLLFGIGLENLAKIPFAPVLTRSEMVASGDVFSLCPHAKVLIVPDIAGFVGADTVGCVLACGMSRREEMTLLVDIGTNGEMVLGNRHRMIACSASAGPALEGASIRCGMGGSTGAIDHVWIEDGRLVFSVIGGGEAAGICGSGLIDAVAAALELGLVNERGRIMNAERTIALTDRVVLTQEDIRQVQSAKGAIAAGIHQMVAAIGIKTADIERVYLAGAFGTYMDPASACRIGLLPRELAGKITAIGNAALGGAKMLACDASVLETAQMLVEKIEHLQLATSPGFQRCFAKNMRFE